MKLLLITSTYPIPGKPHQGVFNQLLVRALEPKHSVRVIAPIPWTDRGILTASQPIPPTIESSVWHPTFYYPPRLLRWTYGAWYWHSIRRTVRKVCESFQPDAVLGYWAHPDGAAAVRTARSLEVPAVIMVGGSDIRLLARAGRRRIAIQSVLREADHVIAFSKDLAQHVRELGIPDEQVDVVYRGVDRTQFHPKDRSTVRGELGIPKDAVLVVWVGRLVDVKNPSLAIRASKRWIERYGERFQLVLIGDGPLRNSLEHLVHELGVSKNCRFLGAMPHEALAPWFQAADLTLLTSLSEGVPNVLLESIACGTPFVATDVGGVREIANAHWDRLVPSEDEVAMQQAVIERLTTPLPSEPRDTSYDVHNLANRVLEIVQKTMDRERCRS